MAWSDKATDAQINALLNLMRWPLPQALAPKAWQYLATKTRGEVSKEMERVRNLYIAHKLDRHNLFDGEIWDGFARFVTGNPNATEVPDE